MAKSTPQKNTKRSTKPRGAAASVSPAKPVKKAEKKAAKPMKKSGKSDSRLSREIRLIIFVFVCFMLAMSYYTPFFGVVGSFIKNLGMFFFGPVAYIVPVFAALAGFHVLIKGTLSPNAYRFIAAILACVCVAGLLTVHSYRLNPTLYGEGYTADEISFAIENNPRYIRYEYSGPFDLLSNIVNAGKGGNGGGILGYIASILFIRLLSPIGTTALLWALMLALAAVATGRAPFLYLAGKIRGLIDDIREKRAEAETEADGESEPLLELPEHAGEVTKKAAKSKKTKKSNEKKRLLETIASLITEDEPAPTKAKTAAGKNGNKKKKRPEGEKNAEVNKVEPHLVTPPSGESGQVRINMFDVPPADGEVPEDIEELAMAESGGVPSKKEDATPIPVTDDEIDTDFIPYTFPPMKLLGREKPSKDTTSQEDVLRMGNKLIETLASFGVEAKINEITRGPAITRFEISPAAGVKVNKIVNLSNDIALNLAAVSVRVIAPIPGKAAVGIEIPNEKVSIVRLRDVVDTDEFRAFKSKTAFALGKDVNGRVIIADISKMPHLLIAGATGSGKSVCINSLITSIIYKADPNEVKLIMIDPKMVELGVYNGIPHLLIPVVTDPRRAAGALNWAVQEMIKRYKLFAENNVRNMAGYNELAELTGERKLEQIIIIVDELADLMMVSAKEVEDSICRLAQMARAAGMYLVIATQRPSVDVITGLIKANVPSRIAFAVSNQIDSRTILDMGGAEKLLGRGDMLFLPMGANTPTRIQGAFVSDAETEAIVEFVKQDFTAKYDEDVIEHIERGVESDRDKEENAGDADEMLPAAIKAVVEAGQASASLLQRRLKVGYARAGRLIDQLEERGIIGPHEGSKPREVLITHSQLLEMEAAGEDNA